MAGPRREISVVFFDGTCHLCDGSVRFIINHDRNDHFYFAPLQSDLGEKVLANLSIDPTTPSIILIEGNRAYTHSSAVLRIAKKLSYPWNLFSIFKMVPKGLRDTAYQLIANNRYRWFGQKNECRLPNTKEMQKFISEPKN